VDENTTVSSRLWELLFGKSGDVTREESRLVIGGDVFGARIYQGYISVEEDTGGVKCGDIIRKVDGEAVSTLRELVFWLEKAEGVHTLTIERGGREIEHKTAGQDECRGIISAASDGAAGIGTVTYIDPTDMTFGGLGHGICDESGKPLDLKSGRVTGVIIGGTKKGEKGHPGELSGILTDRTTGEITTNTDCGIFGRLTDAKIDKSAALPIATRDEVKEGAASIIATVKNGKKMTYAVEIHDVNTAETGTKCFKIRVTDPALLALTGGIVRGMSGSPIIQDGKLVGAVTHVLINDPTEGYGIFIENMLNAAENQVQPKAA
jgi:stage IV sporulation protein B